MKRHTRFRPPVSDYPKCPLPYCGKVWAPDKRTASELHREIAEYTNNWNQVRFYECSGGFHWTSDVEGGTKPVTL